MKWSLSAILNISTMPSLRLGKSYFIIFDHGAQKQKLSPTNFCFRLSSRHSRDFDRNRGGLRLGYGDSLLDSTATAQRSRLSDFNRHGRTSIRPSTRRPPTGSIAKEVWITGSSSVMTMSDTDRKHSGDRPRVSDRREVRRIEVVVEPWA